MHFTCCIWCQDLSFKALCNPFGHRNNSQISESMHDSARPEADSQSHKNLIWNFNSKAKPLAISMDIHIIGGKWGIERGGRGSALAAAVENFCHTNLRILGKFHHSFYNCSKIPQWFSLASSRFSPLSIEFKSFRLTLCRIYHLIFHISTNLDHKSFWLHLHSARRVSNITKVPHSPFSPPRQPLHATLSYKRLFAINSSTKLWFVWP